MSDKGVWATHSDEISDELLAIATNDTANQGLYFSANDTAASEVLLATVIDHTVTSSDIHVVARVDRAISGESRNRSRHRRTGTTRHARIARCPWGRRARAGCTSVPPAGPRTVAPLPACLVHRTATLR
jgi:hypothetical protein